MLKLKNILKESKVGYLVEQPKGSDKVDPKKQKILDKEIKYKDKKGKEKTITVGGALKQGKEHPAHKQSSSYDETR